MSISRSQLNIVQQEAVEANACLKARAHLNIASSRESIFKGYVFAICESIPPERVSSRGFFIEVLSNSIHTTLCDRKCAR